MDLRNSNGFELSNFYFAIVWKLFRKFSSEVEKCIMWSSIHVLPNQVSKRSFNTFKDIDLESLMQSYIKNRVNLWSRLNLKVRNQCLLSSSEL